MRTRTRLTTPPGQQPRAEYSSSRTSEHYSPGLAVPEEPTFPGRRRKFAYVAATLIVLALIAYGVFQVVTSGQTFDPALNRDAGTEAP